MTLAAFIEAIDLQGIVWSLIHYPHNRGSIHPSQKEVLKLYYQHQNNSKKRILSPRFEKGMASKTRKMLNK